jgi:prepilin-type processing-associated H-X9-DG protein
MRRIIQPLVAALVLVLGGGLLVAGVAEVRASAARMSCRNNLRQLGCAVHNYSASMGSLPTAAMPNANLSFPERLSWLVSIVPYVEQDNIYCRLDISQGWDAEENRFAALTPFAYFRCPAYAEGTPTTTLARSNYVGCAGVGLDAADLPVGYPRTGFFGYDRPLRWADIPGRSSTLLMVLETGRPEGAWTAEGTSTVRGLEPELPPYLGTGAQFGGLHPGGANLLFADGSARWASRSIRPDLLESFALLRDGEDLTPLPEY